LTRRGNAVWPMLTRIDPANSGNTDPADPGAHKKDQPMSRTIIDLRSLLSDEHRAHLDALGPRYSLMSGFTMKKDDDEDPPEDEEDEEEEDDEDDADPESTITLGGKKVKVADAQRIVAREKRQGKRSGINEALKTLGFEGKSLDEAKAEIAKLTKKKPAASQEDETDESGAEALAEERATLARERREAAKKARRADLRGALREEGVAREDLDDAFAILDREVDDEYDEDDLIDAVTTLRDRRPGLFGEDDGDEAAAAAAAARKNRGNLPKGRSRKPRPQAQPFGAGGLERARRRGFIPEKTS